jgi:hypothetical protein
MGERSVGAVPTLSEANAPRYFPVRYVLTKVAGPDYAHTASRVFVKMKPYRVLGLMVRDAPQAALLTMRV